MGVDVGKALWWFRRFGLRNFALMIGAGTLFAATVVLPLYGALVETRRLVMRRWTVTPPGWPAGRTVRIVVVTDTHVGTPPMTPVRLRRAIDRANAEEADLAVFLGDLMAVAQKGGRAAIDAAAAEIGRLRAPGGTWAVLGNHDWWDDGAAQEREGMPVDVGEALETAGVPVLHNEARRIEAGGGPLWIAGLGDQRALDKRPAPIGLHDLDGTLAQVTDDAPIVLLAHEPDIFPEVPARVAVTLSGHTHGGQVQLFGWVPHVPSEFGTRYAYGHLREGDRDLVVSGGLGNTALPVRFGRPPEITVITLAAP